MSEILKIANNILHLLDYSQKLTDEEILFSDEFYISILTNLLTEQNKELIPGQTPEQKVKSLKNLIRTLSDIIEIDLSQINAEGIIMNHDKESAKSLLELIEELIKTLINSNTIEAKEENNNKKNEEEENEYESEELINENDINSVNIKKLRERMKLSDDIDNEENENSSYKRKYAELEDGIDNLNDNFEEEEKENENKSMNINYNSEDKNNESGSRVMNVSHISEMEKNKIQELSSSKEKNKKNKKIKDIIELEENNPSSKKSNTKTNKKKYEEIPNLLINKIKKDTDNNNIEKENDEESIKYNNYLESNSNMGESNLYGEENYNVPQSVPRAYNKLHLSNDSNESENSNNHYIRSKKKLNKKKEKENQSSNNTNSNINNEKNITDEYNEEINISSTNKKNKEVTLNSKKISENNEKNIQNVNEEEEDDISKSSEYSQNVQKSSKKSSASKISKNKNKKISYENINYIEIPMSNEEMKYLIKKELRKLYGEKASQYFKKDFLELISENLKETRKAIIKYETGKEADDFFSREFFQKYLKEMQKIIKNCINELNKENVYKKNVIMNLGNNIKIVKKLKDAENKEISNDIENKKNDFNSRNDEINMNNLNQILMYPKYCYELQKKIHLLQIQNQIEFNYALEQERENKLEETKKNYEEHISTLNKILKQRKKERLNKKKFGELLESSLKEMKKSKLRKQVEDMLDQIDEDDEKINVEDNNEQIEKIMKNII